ncbi:MAG: rod shape-determining protein RodA [Bacteroidales bacterium]|nr:rod shape-determining protein RodA [Bacteroidales bacterium]MDD6921532.1 rod shape-determining protein RodA [Bacteroidales bacterium]
MQNRSPLLSVDWVVVAIYLILLVCGWFSICGATHELGDTNFFDWDTRTGKQLVWIGLALMLAFVLLLLDDRYLDTLSGLFYWLMVAVLFITPFIAKDIKGSRSWISLGICNIQPAEFAKCATALAVAKLINQYGFTLSEMRNFAKAAGLILLPMVLIVLQKETGSALVYLAFFLMFYREGMPGCILFCAVAAVAYFVVGIRFGEVLLPGTQATVGEFSVLLMIWLFTLGMLRIYCPRSRHALHLLAVGAGVLTASLLLSLCIVPVDISWALIGLMVYMVGYLAWQSLSERLNSYLLIAVFALGSTAFLYASDYVLNDVLEPHQRTRIQVLLGMNDDKRDAGYNVNQSKIAIGSGGLEGKGFMNGTQTKLKYVPEQDTDFIFCTVGEEQGFVGSAAVLLLFLSLILRLIFLAERQTSVFGRVYGYSIMSILLFHVFINVGMVMGLTPVIGIPLPFFSYGGSSLWGFTLTLFIFLRIDAGRKRN